LVWKLKRGDSGVEEGAHTLGYAGWTDERREWKELLNIEELPQIYVVLVEKNRVRVFLVREGELCSRVEYPSVLDEELHIWLRELAASKRKPKV
jgi:hypothetical protein